MTPAKLFQSRPDGEYRRCSRCAHLGYGEDAWHPCTSEFWPRVRGKLWFGRCLACASELTSRRLGVVRAIGRAWTVLTGARHA